jgi:hypothetical protein
MTNAKDRLIEQQNDFITMALMPRISTQEPTLRDLFAMAALEGLMTSDPDANVLLKAKYCYEAADAMLAEREKKDG